eukprot:GHVN01006711.1.p1 GENE.GHVN01006711.1~~GHVN01006711.1.p1  ORF type:complete len:231 (+),score=20.15 GHVN01006711.1:563-1255(+)
MYNYTTEAFHMYSYNAQTMLVGCLSKAQDVPASFGLSQRMTQQNGAKQSFSPRIEGVFLILGQSRLLEQHNKRHQGQCYSRDTSTSARSSGFPTMTVICLWLLYLFYFNCLKMPQKELVSAPLSDGGTYLETFFVNPTHKEDGDPIEIESPFDDSSPPTTARSHYALSAQNYPTQQRLQVVKKSLTSRSPNQTLKLQLYLQSRSECTRIRVWLSVNLPGSPPFDTSRVRL